MNIPWPVAHLIGDYLFQNDWMQKKTASSFHAAIHAFTYALPFLCCGLRWWQVAVIAAQHFAQDRLGWAKIWQRFVRQTPPDKWPVGTLLVDQTIHVLFIAWVVQL